MKNCVTLLFSILFFTAFNLFSQNSNELSHKYYNALANIKVLQFEKSAFKCQYKWLKKRHPEFQQSISKQGDSLVKKSRKFKRGIRGELRLSHKKYKKEIKNKIEQEKKTLRKLKQEIVLLKNGKKIIKDIKFNIDTSDFNFDEIVLNNHELYVSSVSKSGVCRCAW